MADASGIAADRLRSFIERVERLEAEKAAIADDIKEVFAEAKSAGFETKIMRMIVKLRKMDSQERAEQEQLLEVYAQAVGLAYTPLGDAAAAREAETPKGRARNADTALADAVRRMVQEPGSTVTLRGDGVGVKVENVDGKVTVSALPGHGGPVSAAPPETFDPDTGELPPRDAAVTTPPKDVAGAISGLKTAMHAPVR